MKNNYLKYIIILFATSIIDNVAKAENIKIINHYFAVQQNNWRYEIEAETGVGVQGTYLIKVWSFSKKSKLDYELAKKNAIHAILFRGFSGKNGIAGKPPLITDYSIENEHKDFFITFFQNNGKYNDFIDIVNYGTIGVGDLIKIGKEYKIGIVVSVKVNLLRQYLEENQIIKKLGL